MTAPTNDPNVALVRGVVDNADRLGLKWNRVKATVQDGDDPSAVIAVVDGDTTAMPMFSMVGSLLKGDRVYVDIVPPSGMYIVGVINPSGRDVIAYGSRNTSSGTTTAERSVLLLAGIPLQPGYQYHFYTSGLLVDSDVNGDSAGVRIRYTTDGSTPGLASTLFTGSLEVVTASAGQTVTPLSRIYRPSGIETLSLLMTVYRAAGTGNVGLTFVNGFPIDMTVENTGLAPTDTGQAL